ncbi:MAG: ADP-ribosylglycohydrolase family protein [Proteobacteria bacterium]|nr:ADP-ribosylglycohydrolase family protein [Pseudomonadota bacterium]
MTDLSESSFGGCLVGMLVGEAMGARVEGLNREAIARRFGGVAGLAKLTPGAPGPAALSTAAVAASLVVAPDFDGEDLALRMLAAWDPEQSWGQGSDAALRRLRDGVHWNEAGHSVGGRESFGNGAALRSAPVGLLLSDDAETLRWLAEEAAGLTHQHLLSGEGAVLHAMTVALALLASGEALSGAGLLETLAGETRTREFASRLKAAAAMVGRSRGDATVIETLGNNSSALGSVVTAAWCFAEHSDSYTDTVCRAMSLGGSVSSIAAMAGAASGAFLGVDAIPARWRDAVPPGGISVAEMVELARGLFDVVAGPGEAKADYDQA